MFRTQLVVCPVCPAKLNAYAQVVDYNLEGDAT